MRSAARSAHRAWAGQDVEGSVYTVQLLPNASLPLAGDAPPGRAGGVHAMAAQAAMAAAAAALGGGAGEGGKAALLASAFVFRSLGPVAQPAAAAAATVPSPPDGPSTAAGPTADAAALPPPFCQPAASSQLPPQAAIMQWQPKIRAAMIDAADGDDDLALAAMPATHPRNAAMAASPVAAPSSSASAVPAAVSAAAVPQQGAGSAHLPALASAAPAGRAAAYAARIGCALAVAAAAVLAAYGPRTATNRFLGRTSGDAVGQVGQARDGDILTSSPRLARFPGLREAARVLGWQPRNGASGLRGSAWSWYGDSSPSSGDLTARILEL